jgi:hypothetical protein
MTRWCYKTVHYELKKEGILGDVFLDESEIEESLNEYGRAGWELVSFMEIHGGLIAIFKQPIILSTGHVEKFNEPERKEESQNQEIYDKTPAQPPEEKEETVAKEKEESNGVGTIRIE